MQTLFDTHYPSLDIQILGVNEDGFESQNALMSAEGDLPWLQDTDTNSNGSSDVWTESWNVTYRDVQIVDRSGNLAEIYNVTSNNLSQTANFNSLRDKFVALAATPALSDWQSPTEPLDVNEDGLVAPVDALISINALNDGKSGALAGTPGAGDFRIDVTGDGTLSPRDPLFVINHLNRDYVPPAAAMASAAVDAAPEARSVDVAFATYAADIDEDDDENDDDENDV